MIVRVVAKDCTETKTMDWGEFGECSLCSLLAVLGLRRALDRVEIVHIIHSYGYRCSLFGGFRSPVFHPGSGERCGAPLKLKVLALYFLIWVCSEKVLALWTWPQTLNHESSKNETLEKTIFIWNIMIDVTSPFEKHNILQSV